MMEHITGGYIHCGYHEVVYTEATKEAYLKAKDSGKNLLWRVSSTLFSHLRYDVDISPLPELKDFFSEDHALKYPKMTAHEKLMEELRAINLAPTDDAPASGM
jgi:isopenicillin N synthase-like dioxygenase